MKFLAKNDFPHTPDTHFSIRDKNASTWIQKYHRNSVLISGTGCLEQIKTPVVKNQSENASRFRKHVLFPRRWIIARLHSVTEKLCEYKKVTGRRIESIRVIESCRGASHQIHHILMTSLYVRGRMFGFSYAVFASSSTRRMDIVDRRE